MSAIEPETVAAALADALLKITVWLLIGLFARRLLSGNSPAPRHASSALTVGGALALLFLAPLAPIRLPLAVWPDTLRPDPGVPALIASRPVLPAPPGPTPNNDVPPARSAPPTTVPDPITTKSPEARRIEFPAISGAEIVAGAAAIVWLLGALAGLFRLARGLIGLRNLRRASAPAESPELDSTLRDCSRALGLRRSPTVRIGPKSLETPVVFGWRNPVLLLPPGAVSWPDNLLRAALLHECAHLRRRDWPALILAEVALAVFWFHPLVHFAARNLRADAELAADSLALDVATPLKLCPTDYADALVAIARFPKESPL